MQNRVLSSLCLDGSRLFPFPLTQYWTPHSSRAYLPSATLVLEFPKSQRYFVGGWNAQASDRYARTARRTITTLQRAVVGALHSGKSDPLAEQDLAEHFEEYLVAQRITPASVVQCVTLLRKPFSRRYVLDPRVPPIPPKSSSTLTTFATSAPGVSTMRQRRTPARPKAHHSLRKRHDRSERRQRFWALQKLSRTGSRTNPPNRRVGSVLRAERFSTAAEKAAHVAHFGCPSGVVVIA